jgi:hypothetical protein
MTTERPEANTGQAKSSSPDTGEAIDRILYDYTFSSRNPEGYGKGMAVAKQQLQELIRGEVVKELEGILNIPSKYIDDNTMVYWSDFSADTLEKIILARIAALSSGQTDGHA